MIQKVLIANRGEIAVRVIRACREMGIKTVAVYSMADKDALHTQLADEAVCVGEAASADSYLNMENIISATVSTGADAIHPGFGFLSENSRFAHLCETCNITFIGPPSEVIRKMGNKSEAKKMMREAQVPVIPGSMEALNDLCTAKKKAEEIGFPIMIKAALGGGGKGMRLANSMDEFEHAFLAAQKEAKTSFNDDSMYLERFIQSPRHIEFQILADAYGNVVHLGERDCSIQRNHQKLIEEAPSSALTEKQRMEMGDTAVRAAKAAGYMNAGTIEFLLEPNGQFYFMEMNTRIQVEHPVTEWVTGLDLIKEQINIAQKEKLNITQKDVKINGHAIECRINAENPAKGFAPSPGRIKEVHLPGGNGIRVDTAVYCGYTVPPYYDSMLIKLSVHDKTRSEAIQKLQSALGEVIVEGINTNIDYQYDLMQHPDYLSGNFDINFVDNYNKRWVK